MIRLIQNELKKIFKKKAIFITLIITLAFVILTNILYSIEDNYEYDFESEIKFYETELQNMTDKEDKTSCKTEIAALKLMQKYGYDSWQSTIIRENCGDTFLQLILIKREVLQKN